MKLYLIPNTSAERYIIKLKKVISSLNESHFCAMSKEDSLCIYGNTEMTSFSIEECDLVVSLGGDGTFLRAAKKALRYEKPLCGINCGKLGYLCAFRMDSIYSFETLHKEKHSTLSIDHTETVAINDIVIGKDYFGGAVELEVKVNDKTLYSFHGDGLIVSTCLGSTGYNRSAGGEVFSDDELLEITPICPSNLSRPVIIEKTDTVSVKLLSKSYTASVFADGEYIEPLEEILIVSGEKNITILR